MAEKIKLTDEMWYISKDCTPSLLYISLMFFLMATNFKHGTATKNNEHNCDK